MSSPRPQRFCLVRHGVTAPQLERRYCGHSDPPLAAAGVEQMRTLRRRLEAELPPDTPAFCSDLRRATASAALAWAGLALALPELREIDFGAWEGKRFEETGCEDAERLRDWEFRFPGGESASDLYARVRVAWRQMASVPAPAALIVGHAGSLQALTMLVRRLRPEQRWSDPDLEPLPHGGVRWLEVGLPGEAEP